MKIVQSFWSKPFLHKDKNITEHRNVGGWKSKKAFFRSITLSCLRLLEYYDEVELVTDQFGKELLIDQLKLPYTSVKVELDTLNDYDPSLWALGKLYAYSIQEKPFIHVDSDVFIWKRLTELEHLPLIAQEPETSNEEAYDEVVDDIEKSFLWQPNYLKEYFKCVRKDNQTIAYNAGVLGGNDLSFIKKYCEIAFEFIDRNKIQIEKMGDGGINIVVEQGFFWYLAHEQNIDVGTVFKMGEVRQGLMLPLIQFELLPHQTFFHTIGMWKKEPFMEEFIVSSLKSGFPKYHAHINSLAESN